MAKERIEKASTTPLGGGQGTEGSKNPKRPTDVGNVRQVSENRGIPDNLPKKIPASKSHRKAMGGTGPKKIMGV